MKRPILILIPLLLLEALLLIYSWIRVPKPAERAEQVPIHVPRLAGLKAKLNQEPEIQHFSWREVESADYRQYVTNLRRINIPELTVTDIIVADVNRLFAERAMKLKADHKELFELKYWEMISVGSTHRPERNQIKAELDSLNLERVRLINVLLGREINDPLILQKPEAFNFDKPASIYSVDFLPEPKRLAYNALIETAQAEARANIPDGATDDRSMQLMKVMKEKYDAELVKLLSPAEKLEFDARFSQLGQNLRANLMGMQPTQEEFLQIVALRLRYYDEYEGRFSTQDPMQIADRLKAKREVDAQLEPALGTERFLQLQRGTDPDYGRDTRFVIGLGLSQDTANDLYRLREGLRPGADPDQPSVLSPQKLEAAKAATLALLGEEAYRRYTTRLEGKWLTGLPDARAPQSSR